MRVACEITLTDDERQTLTRWSRGRSTPARLVLRAKIVLLGRRGTAEQGHRGRTGDSAKNGGPLAQPLCRSSVWRAWRKTLPGQVARAKVRDAVARKIVAATTQERPAAATHWSTRSLAKHLGVSPSMVQRVWKANRLQPHRVKTFKLVQRQTVRREAGRCGGLVPVAARACDRAVRR